MAYLKADGRFSHVIQTFYYPENFHKKSFVPIKNQSFNSYRMVKVIKIIVVFNHCFALMHVNTYYVTNKCLLVTMCNFITNDFGAH